MIPRPRELLAVYALAVRTLQMGLPAKMVLQDCASSSTKERKIDLVVSNQRPNGLQEKLD